MQHRSFTCQLPQKHTLSFIEVSDHYANNKIKLGIKCFLQAECKKPLFCKSDSCSLKFLTVWYLICDKGRAPSIVATPSVQMNLNDSSHRQTDNVKLTFVSFGTNILGCLKDCQCKSLGSVLNRNRDINIDFVPISIWTKTTIYNSISAQTSICQSDILVCL